MKTKIIISANDKEHEDNINRVMKELGETDKLMFFHKIIRAKKDGFTFLSYIHYIEVKNG